MDKPQKQQKPKKTKEKDDQTHSDSSTTPPKTETVEKRETRSRHEKKRREEMNEVLTEMMELLPQEVQLDAFKLRRTDQKPKRPDKCFIIGNAVEFIKKNTRKPSLLSDSLVRDIFEMSNCFLVTLQNFVIAGITGDYRSIFDVEMIRMIGKDIRCFLDFESATKLSFLNFNPLLPVLLLRSFMGKGMTCRTKINEQNPLELSLICVPDDIRVPPILPRPTVPPPRPVTSKVEMDRPILAALLSRKDPPRALPTHEKPFERQEITRNLAVTTVHATPPMHSDSASTSSCSFLSPSSTSSTSIIPIHPPKPAQRRQKVVPGKRKRLRSVNVIVESYSLDAPPEAEPKPKVPRKSGPPATLPTLLPSAIPTPLTLPAQSFLNSIPQAVNPYDVLAPGYKDIWLRLQSERLLLEERIVAKEGELKNLMLTARSLPHYIAPLSLPQYTFTPQTTLDLITAQNP